MSTQQIAKLIELAREPETHGKWARFCREERLTKDEVFHWRKKLGLPMRGPKKRPPEDIHVRGS